DERDVRGLVVLAVPRAVRHRRVAGEQPHAERDQSRPPRPKVPLAVQRERLVAEHRERAALDPRIARLVGALLRELRDRMGLAIELDALIEANLGRCRDALLVVPRSRGIDIRVSTRAELAKVTMQLATGNRYARRRAP